MNYDSRVQMQEKLMQLYEEGAFQNRSVVIFGSNEPAERMIAFLKTIQVQVAFLLDNNKKKIGSVSFGIPIREPKEALGQFQKDVLILIISKHYYEMLEQLQEMGYQEGIHVVKVLELNDSVNNSLSEETFALYQERAISGERLYENIKQQYPEMDFLFLLPIRAIGDVFLGAGYADAYCKENGVFHPVFVVSGEVYRKIVTYFGYQDVVVVTKSEMDCLEKLYLLCPEHAPILYVSHQKPYTCHLRQIGNYKKIDFASLFRYGLYELKEDIRIQKPEKNQERMLYAKELLASHQLPEKRTVILSPYAKSVAMMDNLFWETLIKALGEKGYVVCTNVAGAGEEPLPGTKPLAFSLECANEVLEMAGVFIGLRSGFCDFVAQAECKKFVLYPDRVYNTKKLIDFFGLSHMGLADDIVELVFQEEKQSEVLENMLELL